MDYTIYNVTNNEKIVLQFEDYTITAFESDDKTYYNGYFKNANNETVNVSFGQETIENAIFKAIITKKDKYSTIERAESGNLHAESNAYIYILNMLK